MKLNLKNPLVFFDLETTGTNINTDRIVEICYLKVYPNGNEESKTMRVNPEMHIPEASTAIHGIHDEDVADCPTFKEIAKDIARDLEGADIAGFNSNRFDVPVLVEEFLRAGIDIDLTKRKFIDVQVIYHKLEQRTLSAAYKFYCGKNLEDAHTAEAATATSALLLITLLLSFEFICMFPVFSVSIVFFPFFGIAQYFVRFVDLLKLLFCCRIVRV